MAILDQIRKKKIAASSDAAASTKTVVEAEPVLKAGVEANAMPTQTHSVVYRPRATEKAARLNSDLRTYVFDVALGAEKQNIKHIIEQTYKVKVERVRTLRMSGKATQRGRVRGHRSDSKKALVTLAEGQKIDLHAGV